MLVYGRGKFKRKVFLLIMNDILSSLSKEKWKRIGTNRRSGMLIPLFCVYSKDSLGIGDFSDLRLVVDFVCLCRNSIVQLLPMNELGMDFCPYDSLSSFALEPAYVSFRELFVGKNIDLKLYIDKLKKQLPDRTTHLDYKVKDLKLKFLKLIFEEQKNVSSAEFEQFKEDNSYWVEDFCLFKVLKDFHKGLAWHKWQQPFKDREHSALEKFKIENKIGLEFQVWVQWQLYRQFKSSKEYANKRGVYIKGDLPILVSRDSAEVWAKRDFFKLHLSAGAPVDMYCAKGQRWGMPTYNWENIARDGYGFIKERLAYAENFYDMVRLDHVVGLFRIWSIPFEEPLENQGMNGFFDPEDEFIWLKHGKDILSAMLASTDMLICAEDLGTVPEGCADILKELGIPGNDIQRWMKNWFDSHDFISPSDYREISVAMLSTHDTTNWFGWWEFEAGTIDESIFERFCLEKNINFSNIKEKLFSRDLSSYGRLRWLDSVDSVKKLSEYLSQPVKYLYQIMNMYLDTFKEKDKLLTQFKLQIPYQEKCSQSIIFGAYKKNMEARCIFCIQSIIDILYMIGILKDDSYNNRFNIPGTINSKNWSLLLPVSIEELLESNLIGKVKEVTLSSGRAV